MSFTDFSYIIKWWGMFFLIGLIFLPLTAKIFSNFFDRGYVFSKIIGIAAISYLVFILGILKMVPFHTSYILVIIGLFAVPNFFILKKNYSTINLKSSLPIFVIEEIIFLSVLFFFSYRYIVQCRKLQNEVHKKYAGGRALITRLTVTRLCAGLTRK